MNKQASNERSMESWKLPARFTPIAFAFFMSAIMAFLMCMVITAANNGISDQYLHQVVKAYEMAMPVAFICVIAVRPIVLILVKKTVRG